MKKKKKDCKIRNRMSLTLFFSLIAFVLQIVSITVTAVLVFAGSQFGWFDTLFYIGGDITPLLLFMSVSSLIIGFATAVFTMKYPLMPFNKMITQMNRLASGDYKARLEFGKPLASYPVFKEMSESFNKMAKELDSTETLSSDFINNFSHEFKTPIVSVAGYAKLLKRCDLSEERKTEYLDIIEKEALRLSDMAASVLTLTKIENSNILTAVSKFNLSEQIRGCILLLEKKWTEKKLELELGFGEFEIEANEDMTAQIWINLLDNAFKFAPEYASVEVKIEETEDSVFVSVLNTGSEIPPEEIPRIFGKFYRAKNHGGFDGSGVGLATVKKIAELHGGEVCAKSENDVTKFTVTLPKYQTNFQTIKQ